MNAMNRRDFLKWMFGALAGALTLALSWPFFSYLLSPSSRKEKEKYIKVPRFSSVVLEKPTKLVFQYVEEEGFLRQNLFYDIWVIKHSASEATVFSPMCTHLNCRYNWSPSEGEFICPCHASVFNQKGEVVAGPAPRGLDTLAHKIEGGELYVEWKVFKPGISQSVEV